MNGSSNAEALEAISLILGAMAEAYRQLDSSIASGKPPEELRRELAHAVKELRDGLDYLNDVCKE